MFLLLCLAGYLCLSVRHCVFHIVSCWTFDVSLQSVVLCSSVQLRYLELDECFQGLLLSDIKQVQNSFSLGLT